MTRPHSAATRIRARVVAALVSAVVVSSSLLGAPVVAASPAPRPPGVEDSTAHSDGARVVEREAVPLSLPTDAGIAVEGNDPSVGTRAVESLPGLPADPTPPVPTEITDWRTEHSRSILNPDGTITAEYSGGRLHYPAANGEMLPLDLSFVPETSDVGYQVSVAASDRDITFATKDIEAALAAIKADGVQVSIRAIDFPGVLAAPVLDDAPTGSPAPGESTPPAPSQTPAPPGSALPEAQSPVPSMDVDVPLASPGGDPREAPSTAPTPTPPPIAAADPSPSTDTASPPPTPTLAPGEPSPQPSVPPSPTPTPISDAVPDWVFDEPQLAFDGGVGQGQLVVAPTDDGVEVSVILDSMTDLSTYAFAIDIATLEAVLREDGQTIDLVGVTRGEGAPGRAVTGVIRAPIVFDADGLVAPKDAITVSVYRPGVDLVPPPGISAAAVAGLRPTEILVAYAIDPTWLADPAVTFPVTLDPQVCIQAGGSGCTTAVFEHYIAEGVPGSAPIPSQWFRTGYSSAADNFENMRSLLYFGDVALPDGAQVIGATLSVTQDENRDQSNVPNIQARLVTATWGSSSTWTQMRIKYDGSYASPNVNPCSTSLTADCRLDIPVEDVVRAWYTRRGVDWKPNIGFQLAYTNEGPSVLETRFYLTGAGPTGSNPKLAISYFVPANEIDFAPALGPNYAPSTMVAGTKATLSLLVDNNSSSAWGLCTTASVTDCSAIGYRWFDSKAKLVAWDKSGVSGTVSAGQQDYALDLDVLPPATPGAYTLRLDYVRMDGGWNGTPVWASDYAKPSKYYSRDKKSLSSDNTRWTGSSVIEREEFQISVVGGGGTSTGELRTVELGDGGSLGLNLSSRNLHYEGAGGVGFDDLIPLELQYGYDSRNAVLDAADAAGCTEGVLDACGWYTNWDERLTADPTLPGVYTYQAPSGNRYQVDTDGNGQLISGAPVLLERVRYTGFDENRPSNATATGVPTTTAPGFVASGTDGVSAPSGGFMVKALSNSSTLIGGLGQLDLNAYHQVSFRIKTTSAGTSGIALKIHNASDPGTYPDEWFVYTLGTVNWTSGFTQAYLGPGQSLTTWREYTDNLYARVRGDSDFGKPEHSYQVTAFQIQSNGGTGNTYLDALRFTGVDRAVLTETEPAWSSGDASLSTDAAVGTYSLKITASTGALAPSCQSSCFSGIDTIGDLYSKPFATWQWKKVGGTSVAIEFNVKDKRTNAVGQVTYYAGPVAPAGATNPIQVSPTVPVTWTPVTRNVLEDARQVLNFFNDSPTGSSPGAPPSQGPIPDEVQWIGVKPWAPDGSYALVDDLRYGSIPDRGDPTALIEDDYRASYADGSSHVFNRDGLLQEIRDRDGNAVKIFWDRVPTLTGQDGYSLASIRAPSDNGSSYIRRFDVTNGATVTFAENLGPAVTGRTTAFTIAAGDVTTIRPARQNPTCAGSQPTGCVALAYGSAHVLSRIADPRWDGTTTGANDYRYDVTWSTSANPAGDAATYPVAILDRSHSSAKLLSVTKWNAGGASPASARVLWQDADSAAQSMGQYTDLTADGSVLYDYVPLPCGGSPCAPSTAGLSSQKSAANEFDGLSRVSTTRQYSTPSSTPLVSRQGTNAAAKVDNYNDPLAAGGIGWTQSPDQYFASVQDSGASNPDLYRSFTTQDALGNRQTATTLAFNARPDYAGATKSLVGTPTNLKGYWRLGETLGTAATDLATPPHNGLYGGTPGLAGPGALVGDSDKAPVFSGDDTVTVPTALGSISAPFTVSVWAKPANTTGTLSILGSRGSSEETFDLKFVGGNLVHADIGTGTAWLTTAADAQLAYVADRWYHLTYVVAATSWTAYVDGRPTATGALSGTAKLTNTQSLTVGNPGFSGEWFSGSIDEVAVYGQALTAPQVLNQHLAGRAVAAHTARTVYDGEGHPIQVDDQFLASPGFESGAGDWEVATGVTADASQAHPPIDPNQPPSLLSLAVPVSKNALQDAQLVPGQTFRFQVWEKYSASTASARIDVTYWKRSTGQWTSAIGQTTGSASWTSHAWDVTLPLDTDGRVRVALSATGSAGTVYFDDAALLTSYARTSYTANGLTDYAHTFAAADGSGGGSGEIALHSLYAATSDHPAIFATSSIANWIDGAPGPGSDEDVTSTVTYDPWGRTVSSTDPDGVATETHYRSTSGNGYATDVDWSEDGLDNRTTFAYDLVGNQITATSPLGPATATAYDLPGHVTQSIAPDGTVSRNDYDAYGHLITSWGNYIDGNPNGGAGIDDVQTSLAYDEFGRVTSTIENDAGGTAGAKSVSTYDLLDRPTSTTVYSTYSGGSFGGDRKTESRPATATDAVGAITRPAMAGTRGPGNAAMAGPLVPTGAPAPACPSGGGYCNGVTGFDLNGLAISSTNAYGVVSRSFYDLAGRSVVSVANYADGVYSSAAPDTDIVSISQYDVGGRVARSVDALGRVTGQTFDAVGRAIQMTSYDAATVATTKVRTVYTRGGRVDRVSAPGGNADPDSALAWTKTVYDRAGRAIKTLAHYDIGGAAGLGLESFETPETNITIANSGSAEAWSSGAGAFIVAGGSGVRQAAAASAASGSGRLAVTTAASGVTGTEWSLDGTFVATHQYQARIWVNAPSGSTITAKLGVAADSATAAGVAGNGTWQPLDMSWTPSAARTGVKLALYRSAAAAITFYVDDAMVWDSAANATDVNIPTETAYDANGQIVASIVAPGTVGGSEHPLVTRTVYDALGRVTSVNVNEIAGDGSGGGGSTTFNPVADAHVRSSSPSSNYGTATTLQVRADPGTPNDYKPFLKFTVSGLSDAVTNVKLRLMNTATSTNSSRVICVYSVADTSWTETGITWATAPAVGSSLACLNGTQAAGWIEYDLGVPFSGNGTYAFAVFENVATSVIYSSKEGADPPQLVVTTGGSGAADANLTTTTTYDALGRVDYTLDPTGTKTKFAYDRLGRVTETTLNYRDGTASGAATDDDVTSKFAYNAAGEMIGYCSGAQVFATGCAPETTANAQAWHYAYDDAGHLVTQTPPVNTTATPLDTTRWVYDAGGRLTRTCDTLASATSCTSGTVHRTSIPTYDAVGRVTRLDTYAGAAVTLALRTDTTYLGDGQVAQTKLSSGTGPTVVDTIDYDYDLLGRPTKVVRQPANTTLSEQGYHPDGTLAWRKDGDANAIGQSSFTYDWADRLTSVDLPDTFSTAVPTFAWRLDGLIKSRTWGAGAAATFAYDRAKRPTGITKGTLSFGQTYDRDGNVATETRSLTGVTGDPGTGTQTFAYDELNRVVSGTGLATPSRTYTYDRDGNRLSKTEGGVTFTYAYDRTDELVSVTKGVLTPQSFSYDTYGNLTGNAETGAAVTAMTYDLANHLTGIDATGTANDAAFTLDALGRFRTRLVNAVSDTYSYVGTSETVSRIVTGGTTTDSIVSPSGDRLGIEQGTTLNWLLPDLHGNVAASLNDSETTVVNAIRYDPYGQTIATGAAGGTAVGAATWTYQGRLDVSSTGQPLYDMSARFYSPGIGAFTQLDSVMGSAQNPLSMNRFLYALANPATLVDPTGHAACMRFIDGVCQGYFSQVKHGKLKPGMSGRSWANRRADRTREFAVEGRSRRDRSGLSNAAKAIKRESIAIGRGQRAARIADTANRDTASFAVAEEMNPFESIARGLGDVVYDNTVGLAEHAVDFATHLDRIPGNLELAGLALTHLDMTAAVAAEDLGNGVSAFGQMSLEEQVRFVGNVGVAAVGPKVIAAGGRAVAVGRALDTAEATELAHAAAVARTEAIQAGGGRLPAAIGGGVDRASGITRTGVAGQDIGALHPDLARRLPAVSKTPWAVTNCAEVAVCNQLLWAGARFEDIVLSTVGVRKGEIVDIPACANCREWIPGR